MIRTLAKLEKLGHSFRLVPEEAYKDFGIGCWEYKEARPKYYHCAGCAAIIYTFDWTCLISSFSPTLVVDCSCKECVIRDIIL